MAVKKRGLGRGLDALLGSAQSREQPKQGAEAGTERNSDSVLCKIALEKIQPGKYQPRQDMDQASLEELAQSVKAQGIMQPIVLRSLDADRYEIIAGERRWRAARLAGLSKIDAVIREVADEDAIAMALIENIQREDLNPLEEALALQRLQQEYELTQQEVANAVGKSRATVANLLRLLALPEEVKILVAHGDIEMGHARALLGLPGEMQGDAARYVAAEGMSVRQTEAYVKAQQQPKPVSQPKVEDPDIRRLEEKLADMLGTTVKIKHGAAGKGQLLIKYTTLNELHSVLSRIN